MTQGNYKIAKLKSFSSKINKKKDKPKEQSGLEVFHEMSVVYRSAVSKYKITPYSGQILVFYAKEHYYFLDKERNVGFKKLYLSDSIKNFWKDYSTSTSVYEIEGEHSLIFDPSHAKEFAEILQQHLDNKT